jgi:hypothetical protein
VRPIYVVFNLLVGMDDSVCCLCHRELKRQSRAEGGEWGGDTFELSTDEVRAGPVHVIFNPLIGVDNDAIACLCH